MAKLLASRSLVKLSSPSSSSSSSPAALLRMPAAEQRRLTQTHRCHRPRGQRMVGVRASSELVEPLTLSSADPDLTWQITVGAIAGVAPFVIAGIEFSKRIGDNVSCLGDVDAHKIQQKRCKVCGGSGLVKRVGILVRCNGCEGHQQMSGSGLLIPCDCEARNLLGWFINPSWNESRAHMQYAKNVGRSGIVWCLYSPSHEEQLVVLYWIGRGFSTLAVVESLFFLRALESTQWIVDQDYMPSGFCSKAGLHEQ